MKRSLPSPAENLFGADTVRTISALDQSRPAQAPLNNLPLSRFGDTLYLMGSGDVGMGRERALLPLTSLRFVAAAMIVLLHGLPVSQLPSISPSLAQGVSFFFVLSG